MVELTEDMVKLIREALKQDTCCFATSLKDKPNAVPIGYTRLENGRIILADFYFTKTMDNLEKNPQVSVCFWNSKTNEGYQIKGKAKVDTGSFFAIVKEDFKNKPYTPRSAVVVTIEEVYTVKPGEYGRKIL